MFLLPVLMYYYGQIATGNTSPALIRDYVVVESIVSGVDPQITQGIVEKESKFNCQAVGDHGTSHGCWQIHLPAHSDISKEKAHDPIWSTKWAIQEIKENGCGIWSTCRSVMASLRVDP